MPTVDLNTGLEEIESGECFEFLAAERVGRLGVVLAGRPEIFPVN
jgi:nitroimidazol reductase NimA-like FMN-containing flavoprotein (pyridoxamine 5'-phosphate oxidase superfamily)